MTSFQHGGAVSSRLRRGKAFLLRGTAFPLCRSIFMGGLHFKRRTSSRHRLLNYGRHLTGLFTSVGLMRGSPAEFSAWLQIHLASKGHQVPPALRELFIFDTESEKQEDLPSFIDDNWRYGMSTDPSRDPTAAVVEWFVKLHSLGFSLSGNFKATNFALNHSDLLRGERKLLNNLRKLTLKRRRRDMESCGDMIEFDFYNREYVRISIATKHLLWLLKHFKPGYSFLVRNHACHEEEDRRISLFEAMCIRLHVLEKMDKPKYSRIIGKLPCC